MDIFLRQPTNTKTPLIESVPLIDSLHQHTIHLAPAFNVPIHTDFHKNYQNLETSYHYHDEYFNPSFMSTQLFSQDIHPLEVSNDSETPQNIYKKESILQEVHIPTQREERRNESETTKQPQTLRVDMNNHFGDIHGQEDIDSIISSLTSKLSDAIHAGTEGFYK